jgi:hypothetical protein
LKFLIIFISLFSTLSLAKKRQDPNTVDQSHQTLSKSIFLFTNRVDQFFGGEDADDNANGSTVRIFTRARQNEGEAPTYDEEIRFNLVLPQLQRRVDDSVQELLGRETSQQRKERLAKEKNRKKSKKKKNNNKKKRVKKNSQQGILESLYNASRLWRINVQTGVNVDWPPQPYVRLKLFRNFFFTQWQMKPLQEIEWVDRQGWRTRTEVNFDKRLSERLLFRIENRMDWSEVLPELRFRNGPSLIHQITGKIGMSYNFRILSTNNVSSHAITNYSTSISYRQDLYKGWLFMSITPALDFPEATGFVKVPSLTLQFDVLFGSV